MPTVRDFKLLKSGEEAGLDDIGDEAAATMYGELDDKRAADWHDRERRENLSKHHHLTIDLGRTDRAGRR